jgi:hypothetical protein
MKKIFTLLVVLAAALGMQADDKYVVAGAESLLGENWNANTEVNVMATSDNGATYTLEKTGVKLRKGANYEFQIVKVDGPADNEKTWYGTGEEGKTNYAVKVDADGEYTVKFTFTVATTTASSEATKTGEAEFGEDVWTLVGSSVFCGNSWDLVDAEGNNTFTTTDNITFTLKKENVVLEAGVKNEFKIALNHSWDISYGKDGTGNNNELTVDKDGVYNLTFTFVNDDTHLLTVDAEYVGEAVIAEKTWTVAGSSELVFGTTWAPTNTDNDMTKQDDGSFVLTKYSITFDGPTTINFKVCANHAWDESYGDNGENMA